MANKGFFAGSAVVGSAPARTLPQCGACGLFKECKTPKFAVQGGGKRRILFVGGAPSKEEDESGVLFQGKAGQRIRAVLRTLKVDHAQDVWYTNALICRTPKSRAVMPSEIEYCRPNLVRAIKELQPYAIVPMGHAAVAAVVGSIWKEDIGPMERWAGWRIPCHEYNAWVCPTWSPAHVLSEDDPVLDRQFAEHIRYATEQAAPPWADGPPQYANDVQLIHDPAQAAAWLRKCAQRTDGAVAWDYETNMLKPDGPDARIVSCAVAWGRTEPERCIAYPWHGEAITATQELIRSPLPKIASNLKFEDRWTRKEFGHRVRGWVWDTMLAAHVCDNRQAITSVKFQAFVRYGVPIWNEKIEPFLKTKGNDQVNAILQQIDISDLLLYNGLDALLEFRVATAQMKELGYPIPWRIE